MPLKTLDNPGEPGWLLTSLFPPLFDRWIMGQYGPSNEVMPTWIDINRCMSVRLVDGNLQLCLHTTGLPHHWRP